MNACLLRAVRKVIHCDSDPVRRELFERLRRTRTSVRLAHALHRMAGRGRLSSVLVAAYGAKSLLSVGLPTDAIPMIGVASQENARRRLNQIAGLLGGGRLQQVRIGLGAAVASRAWAGVARASTSPGRVRRYLRIVGRIDRRHDFLVSCRVASLLGAYPVARAGLIRRRPVAVVVSSDSNPEEIAFTTAARLLGISTVFASHAYPTPASPPLDFDLSIIEGEAALEAYQRRGPVRGKICFAGVSGESIPLDATRFLRPKPAIGVFAPKVVAWDTFARIVEDARTRCDARQVVIRWHPSVLEPPRLDRAIGATSFVVQTPPTESLQSVVSRCDWVVADADSNVHLEVLKLGVPTIAVARFGVVPTERADLCGLVANGVIPPPLASLAAFDPDQLMAFFGKEWPERFRRYDASYLRFDNAVTEDVRQALLALATRHA